MKRDPYLELASPLELSIDADMPLNTVYHYLRERAAPLPAVNKGERIRLWERGPALAFVKHRAKTRYYKPVK